MADQQYTEAEKRIHRLTRQPLFPFEGEMRRRDLSPLMDAELPRAGEPDGGPCMRCGGDATELWRNERFLISPTYGGPNPVGVFVETIAHIDFDDFDESMAAELGVITWHLAQIIEARDDVGRVHTHRYGDGALHFHLWVLGRPARQLELYGWGNLLWAQLLEPLPAGVLETNNREVVEQLAGRIGGELIG